MNLLEFYGPVPWIEEPFKPTFTGWNELTRPTYDEIATKIEEELLSIIDSGVLPEKANPAQNDPRYVDEGIAYSIRARVLRSEERRVGKECVITCSSGWSPYH